MYKKKNKIDVYLITNLINNKKYVGISSYGYIERFHKHINEAENNGERLICKAIRKYGKENFKTELLEQVETDKESCEKEKYYIKKYNTFAFVENPKGYNMTYGGEGIEGYVMKEEQKEFLRNKRKEEHRWEGNDNPMFGKGYLIKGEKHPNYGKHHSKNTIIKISKAQKGKYKATKNPASVICTCYSLELKSGEILKFDSFYEMRKYFEDKGIKLNRSSLIQVIRGERNHHKGYKFFREDITDKNEFLEIEQKYNNKINIPIYLDNNKGSKHPNSKNIECYAYNVNENIIFKSDSWYELKTMIENKYSIKLVYSNMTKVAKDTNKISKGFKFYRKDITNSEEFKNIQQLYIQQF